MKATTLTIRKTNFGRWEVFGAAAGYGHSDSDQSPVCPPSFKTKGAAVAFCDRRVADGEAAGYTVAR